MYYRYWLSEKGFCPRRGLETSSTNSRHARDLYTVYTPVQLYPDTNLQIRLDVYTVNTALLQG